ncbi:unnamed protein product [Periconia digitata]|uniref:Uncharacterized protein n=1 Tax=Periconia digitata TaxID=1303443 RepID=A0A9W4XQF5_9PLEO|nr:unnamed protein product [Periconia digitata]
MNSSQQYKASFTALPQHRHVFMEYIHPGAETPFRDDISTEVSCPSIQDIIGFGRSAGSDGKGVAGAPSPINDLKMPPKELVFMSYGV